ncbi:hypothetical protein RO3G_09288 [Rhizopus delemar RA 99-880]|uniref:Uncharacterized protein n=1 Tax=Rhizopus delemar (strain RA 99-880 / ATCC MYA-4621 / FGSC 9543 / NRRL 43880) TaxID=246409 RepID=I1C7Z8_RHIO9|nr:hypothetical protein RO3G_09288 [Rhizopus delemar RA 99-880]|eukprot:EIE84578.1 hypothetical protein RO3G_09288 [Rhizopus delemar RA 99-880]
MVINYVDADVEFSTPIGQTIPYFKSPTNLISLMIQGQAYGAQIQFTRATKSTVNDWIPCLRDGMIRKLLIRYYLHKAYGIYPFPSAFLATHLPRVEQQIQVLQEEVTPIAILKAEWTWRDRGEMNVGYLKRSATARAVQRSIPRLWDPDNGDVCSSRTQMLDVTQKFYTKLYSPETVCSSALDAMVSKIPSSYRLSKDDSEFMASSFLLKQYRSSVLP